LLGEPICPWIPWYVTVLDLGLAGAVNYPVACQADRSSARE
jgi:hypothetical protein